MANLDESFSEDQRKQAIAEYTGRFLICLAGPGTGKTYSFLKRIENLTNQRNVNVEDICYLTFIKEIADAFRTDYRQEFTGSSEPRISTLHSLACRIIRNQGFRQGFDGNLYFLNTTDTDENSSDIFLKDLLPLLNTPSIRTLPQLRRSIDLIKRAWRNNEPPPTPEIVEPFLNLSQRYRLLDWDFTIQMATQLLQQINPLPSWLSSLKHFLVDEYQDFNNAEQYFLNQLVRQAESIIVVGDDNQSLYSGRGGSPASLRQLYDSPELDKITINQCRRCKEKILLAANKFLARMRPDSHPLIVHSSGGQINCYQFKSAKAELSYLITFLRSAITALPDNPRPKDGIICLFPTKKMLKYYMSLFQAENIPCRSREKKVFKERIFLRLVLTLLKMPNQRFIERLLLEYFEKIKPAHKKSIVDVILQDDISPSKAVEKIQITGLLKGEAKSQSEIYTILCESLASKDVRRAADIIAPRLSLDPNLLMTHFQDFVSSLNEDDSQDDIENICNAILPSTASEPENQHAVFCLTMHGSKGLTKKTVLMPGMERSWIPGEANGEKLEEMQRLYYVALTRATDQVLMTIPKTRARGDPFNRVADGRGEPSPFIIQSGITPIYHP